jgi:TonB family protein
MTRFFLLLVIIFSLCADGSNVAAVQEARPIRTAVLDLGNTGPAQLAYDKISNAFATNADFALIDRDESSPAVHGVGYTGSLNMTIEQARDLGAAIGCDFYVTGDVQTLRRSSSARPVYFESYASIFIVSARTGRLIKWDRPSFEAASPTDSEKLLFNELVNRAASYVKTIQEAERSERNERELSVTSHILLIEEVPEEASPLAKGLRLPQPYRRIRPAYTDSAAKAEVEATVDVLVDLDVEGEVERVEIVRWAGFGLDEETVNTVRRMHFRPAMRDGAPLPMRVLLRYNFVRPKKQNVDEKKAEAGKKSL